MVTFMYVYITHMFGLLGKKCIFFSTIMFVVLLIGEGNDKGGKKSEKNTSFDNELLNHPYWKRTVLA